MDKKWGFVTIDILFYKRRKYVLGKIFTKY